MRELKQFVSASHDEKGRQSVYSAAPQAILDVNFSAFWLLSCLRSSGRRGSSGCSARFLTLRYGFRGYLCFSAVLHFGAGANLLLVRGVILHQSAFALADECQPHVFTVPIDANEIAQVDLFGGQQIRQRINHVALNGALQVPGAVTLIRAFFQQEVAPRGGHAKQELTLGGLQNALLHLPQLNVQHFFQLFTSQRMENDRFIQPVHEFGREFATRGFYRGSLHLLVQPGCRSITRLHKTHSTVHQLRDFPAAEIGSEKNYRLRQVHSPVVAQRQGRLIQDPQQQLPQRVRSLLDFVEKQK